MAERDQGIQWERLPSDSIPLKLTNDVVVINSCQTTSHGPQAPGFLEHDGCSGPEPALLLATSQGIFSFKRDQWTSLYRGLNTPAINDISVNRDQKILIASSQGLYVLVPQS
jgi:hypothetical protein